MCRRRRGHAMDLFEAVRTRRSVKYYDPEHRLSERELRQLVAATMLTPSSFNMQNWQFVVCTDREVQARLCEAAFGQAQVRDCSATFVLAGDLQAHERFDRYLRFAPEMVRGMFEGFVNGIYGGRPEMLRDEACRSIGLASMTLMLAARAMGYDSCPLVGYDPAKVADAVGLPEDCPPLLIVTIGKALEPARPRLGILHYEDCVSFDRYGNRPWQGAADPEEPDAAPA